MGSKDYSDVIEHRYTIHTQACSITIDFIMIALLCHSHTYSFIDGVFISLTRLLY